MENKNKITIIGVPASPYTRKMLSALRYRNIQHSVIWGNAKEILNSMGLETPKPTLLPVVLLHNGSEVTAICDTTPIIRKLEVNNSDRGIIPKNKSLALLNSILEDFGDEWVTKYMFHYRWHFQRDIAVSYTHLTLPTKRIV